MWVFAIPFTWSRRSDVDVATGYHVLAEIRDAGADGASGRGAARLCCDPVPDQRNPFQHRAASARQAFLGYTDLAFKNPKFAQPDYDRIKAGSRDEQAQYESFVTYLLYACEEAISAFAGKREWQASCDYDLKPHLPFLCDKNGAEPAYLQTYGADTQQWVMALMKTASVTPPDCKLRKT